MSFTSWIIVLVFIKFYLIRLLSKFLGSLWSLLYEDLPNLPLFSYKKEIPAGQISVFLHLNPFIQYQNRKELWPGTYHTSARCSGELHSKVDLIPRSTYLLTSHPKLAFVNGLTCLVYCLRFYWITTLFSNCGAAQYLTLSEGVSMPQYRVQCIVGTTKLHLF